jgi:hypothetical protein
MSDTPQHGNHHQKIHARIKRVAAAHAALNEHHKIAATEAAKQHQAMIADRAKRAQNTGQ